MSRIAKLRGVGIFFGISTATWLTLLGQWIASHEQSLPIGLAFPVLGLWVVVLVSPAYLLAHAVSWHWGAVTSLNAAELATVLIVNAILWGLAGMIPSAVLKSGAAAKIGSRIFLGGGLLALLVGCMLRDGEWLIPIGLFVLLLGGVVPLAYFVWFKTSANQRRGNSV